VVMSVTMTPFFARQRKSQAVVRIPCGSSRGPRQKVRTVSRLPTPARLLRAYGRLVTQTGDSHRVRLLPRNVPVVPGAGKVVTGKRARDGQSELLVVLSNAAASLRFLEQPKRAAP
jgi:hypothetical protein